MQSIREKKKNKEITKGSFDVERSLEGRKKTLIVSQMFPGMLPKHLCLHNHFQGLWKRLLELG